MDSDGNFDLSDLDGESSAEETSPKIESSLPSCDLSLIDNKCRHSDLRSTFFDSVSVSCSLDTESRKTLDPCQCLDDNVITYFGSLAVRENCNVSLMDTFFYTLWRAHGNQVTTNLANRWASSRDFLNRSMWLVPLHEHYHWKIVAIIFPKISDSKAYVFDSNVRNDPVNFRSINQFLCDLVTSVEAVNLKPGVSSPIPKLVRAECPQQPNSYDCGVFMLKTLQECVKRLPMLLEAKADGLSANGWYNVKEGTVDFRCQLVETKRRVICIDG